MMIRKFNVFFDAANEERWLDSCGEKGLLLKRRKPFRYYFEKTDTKRRYAVEWLDSSPETAENAAYIKERESSGKCLYCCGAGCSAYFAFRSTAVHSARGVRRTQKRYDRTAIFWAVVAAFFIGLLIYNLIWIGKFDGMGHVIEDNSSVPTFLKSLLVGENPARVFSFVVIPFTGFSVCAAACCFLTSLHYRKCGAGFAKTEEYDK